jgi:hypothetical protein
MKKYDAVHQHAMEIKTVNKLQKLKRKTRTETGCIIQPV